MQTPGRSRPLGPTGRPGGQSPGRCGSIGWSFVLQTERVAGFILVLARAQLASSIPSQGVYERVTDCCFSRDVSLSPPPPLSNRNEKLSSGVGKKKRKEISHWPEGVVIHGTDATANALRGESKAFIGVEGERNLDFVTGKSRKTKTSCFLPGVSSGDRWYFTESAKQEMNQRLK